MIFKIVIIVTAYCPLHCQLSAQSDTVIPLKKATVMATVETVGINVGVWAFNRFVTQEDFARIT